MPPATRRRARVVPALVTAFALAAASPPARSEDPAAAPKYGPPGAPYAVPLSKDHAYLSDGTHEAPDFWALMPYYVPQANDASCSVASVAIVVNGLVRAGRALGNMDRNATQSELVDRVRVEHWKERVGNRGYHREHGLTLSRLKAVTEASLAAFGARDVAVDLVDAGAAGATGLEAFRQVLSVNERTASDFVMLHFVQDAVTAAPGGPYAHISPVGAYDAERRRVLVLDVDREWSEPYWVADDVLWRAMMRKTPAFGSGGYLWIRTAPGAAGGTTAR